MAIFLVFCVSFLTILKVSKTAPSSSSRTPLFFLRKTLLSFYWPSFLSFQKTATLIFPVSSLDPSVNMTDSPRSFFVSSRVCFLHSVIMTSLNVKLESIIFTGSILSARSTECSMVSCYANYCLYNLGRVLCVNTKVFPVALDIDTSHLFFSNWQVKFLSRGASPRD